jgi:hypothetical protein
VDAGVRVAESQHPGVVGAGDRRLAELARFEKEDPVLAGVRVTRFGSGCRAHELLLRGPEHLAEHANRAALLITKVPAIEERAKVARDPNQVLEVVGAILDVKQSCQGERHDDRVRLVLGCVASGQRGRDDVSSLRRRDEFDLHNRRRDLSREPPCPPRLGIAIIRDRAASKRMQDAAEHHAVGRRDPRFRGREPVKRVGRRQRCLGFRKVAKRDHAALPRSRRKGATLQGCGLRIGRVAETGEASWAAS